MQTPGGSPQGSFGSQPPYDPSFSSVPPGSGYQPPRQAQLRFDAIGEAWNLLKPTLGVWIPTLIIYVVIVGIISTVIGAITGTNAVQTPQAGGNPFGTPGAPAVAAPNPIMMLVSIVLNSILSAFFTGGLARMAANQVRGKTPSIGDLFSAADVVPALIVASILTSIATFIGFMHCVIPGLLVMSGLIFTNFLIADQRMGAIEAMSTSWNALKGQILMALLFVIVVGIVAASGVLACGIGMLVTAPLALLTIAIAYRDFFLGQQASFAETPNPNAPPIPPVSF